jgi:hypothetical protein
MSARLPELSDERLGAALASLDLDWPDVPSMAPAVRDAIAREPRPVVRLPRRRRTKVLLIAAAVTLLLAGAAVAAKLVIDLGAVVVRVPEGGGALPTASPVPVGELITLDDASDLLGSEVAVPAALGRPDRVWADRVITEEGRVVRVTMAWRPEADLPAIEGTGFGAVLTRFVGSVEIASKEVFEDTGSVAPALVGREEAYWTTGPHLLKLLTSEGVVSVRVDGNVLLWQQGAETYRLETTVSKPEAERIAETLPGTS